MLRKENGKRHVLKRMMLVTAVVVMAITAGTAAAYFTDSDEEVNTFTIGNVDIALDEPSWAAENGEDITPLEEIAKDPVVSNEGANDAFVFTEVTVPRASVVTADESGAVQSEVLQDLFTYEVNSGWKQIAKSADEKKSVYTYAYVDSGGALKPLEKDAVTEPVFESVTFINMIEGQLDGGEVEIKVEAMAIQTDGIAPDQPQEVLALIRA